MRSVLHLLIRWFPPSFREQFGADMRDQIDHEYAAARARGWASAIGFFIATAADLTRSCIAEHANPTWTQTTCAETADMIWTRQGWNRDLRHAARSLLRSPGFAAVTIGTLGLAIGVNAAMFTVVDRVLLEPLPFAHADRLVHIAATAPGSGFPDEFGLSSEFYVAYRESKLIEDLSTYNSFTSTLRAGDRVERIRMSWPTNSLFTTLGVRPILGRLPVREDGEHAAVISYKLWQTWFAGDPAVIGRSYQIGGAQRTVIGVMGESFKFPNDETMLWISSDITPSGIVPGRFGPSYVARIKPGVTTEALANTLTAVSKTFPQRFGGSPRYAKIMQQHRAVVRSLSDQLLGPVSQPLWVLLGAVAVVLVIACANVSNLFIVRSEGRQRDLVVRRAIGAARGQLIQVQLAEAVVVAACAALAAIVLAFMALPAFLRAAPATMPRIGDVHFGLATLGFTAGAAIFAALICGLIPAVRGSVPDLTRLRDGTRSTRQKSWARDALVVGQTALALVLLIGSGLLVRSFWSLKHVNPGYSTADRFTFQIAPEGPALFDGPSVARFDLSFLDRLAQLPSVESVGLVENVPLDEGTAGTSFRTESMTDDKDGGVRLQYTYSAGDYFKTMGIRLLRGRAFERNDHLTAQQYVVISNTAARLLWPGKDPIGQRLKMQGLDSWETVIGVVDDVMQDDFRTKPQPLVYLPLVGPQPNSWIVSSPAYVIKTKRAELIAPEVRALVREVAPSAPMYRAFTLAALARRSMIQLSFTMLTLLIVSALALVLGAVGLYGVLSYVVTQRRREIGVRMALGAEARAVRRMVVGQGARVVAVGIGLGIVAAWLSTRSLASLLYDVKPVDAATFIAMSAWMIAIGLLASYVPARRASRVDPIESLRGD